MNPTLILTIVLGILSLTDFINPNEYKKLHKYTYSFSFIFFFIIVSIKYYYGSDIYTYVPHYDNIKEPISFFLNNGFTNSNFDPGYEIYCSVLKYFGLSYWGMTFISTCIYFFTIHILFKKLTGYKTFALLMLVFFENNLFFFENRQLISVCFFIFSFLSYDNKKYFLSFIFIIVSGFLHKSGFLIGICTFIILSINGFEFSKKIYLYFAILLLILILIDLKPILINVSNILPLSSIVRASIKHHLTLTRNIQVIAIFYLLSLYTIYFCENMKNFNRNWHRIIILLFGFITILYQDYFLLNRIRSFFVPIAIVYVFNLLNNLESNKGLLYKQLLVILFYCTSTFAAIKLELNAKELTSGVAEYTTVFSLLENSEVQIKNDKLKRAKDYWVKEYLKNQEN